MKTRIRLSQSSPGEPVNLLTDPEIHYRCLYKPKSDRQNYPVKIDVQKMSVFIVHRTEAQRLFAVLLHCGNGERLRSLRIAFPPTVLFSGY